MPDALRHRIFPSRIAVGVKVFIHRRIGFFYLGIGSTLKTCMQVASEIPSQGKLPVPQETLIPCQRKSRAFYRLHVTLLQFVVVAGHLGVERQVLRQPVETETLEYVEPLRLVLDALERLPRFVDGCPVVVKCPPPVVFFLIDGGLSGSVLV